MQIVINKCYGGFNLSSKALKRYCELKYPNKKLYRYKANFNNYEKIDDETNDPLVII